MTKRDRTLATVGGGLVVVALAVFGGLWFWNAIVAGMEEKKLLQDQIDTADAEISRVIKSRLRVEQFRRLSLPANSSTAHSVYRRDLETMIRANGLTIENFGEASQDTKSSVMHPSKPGKVPIYTGTIYTVRVKTNLGNLVSFLQAFQRAPTTHRIKNMTVERSSSSKDTGLLTVSLGFEGLSILDAESFKKKSITPDQKFLMPELVASVLKAPAGFGGIAWFLSPQGPYVPSINPPLQARQYDDIRRKDIFYGTQTGGGNTDPPKPPRPSNTDLKDFGVRASDTTINMMRFTRFVSLVTDDQGKSQGTFWDMYNHNPKTTQKVTTSAGLKTFGMVQTAQGSPIVQGIIQKVENNDLIYRIGLKAYEPSNGSKWWRYPTHEGYYTLHADDLAPLVSSGKVKAADKANVYLISQAYWEKELIKTGKPQVEQSSDHKSFRYLNDPSLRGDLVFEDREVRIIRLNHTPPTTPIPPSISAERVYQDSKTIYRVQTKHFNDMLDANKAAHAAVAKSAKGKGKAKGDDMLVLSKNDIERVYCCHAYFWNFMIYHNIMRADTRNGLFYFYKDTVCGDILSQTADLVVFRVFEKYTKCAADPDRGLKEHLHEGFCILRLDHFVQDSLQEPLPEKRVKEFLH